MESLTRPRRYAPHGPLRPSPAAPSTRSPTWQSRTWSSWLRSARPLSRQLPPLRPRSATPTRNAPAYRARRGGRCRRMLFPPPWFSPLGTPLSEAPPFKKGNPPGGKTHPGGHSTALFRLCVAALHRARVPDLPKTAVPEHVHGLGGRHHSAALPIPPTPQGIRAHRPHYVLSPECPASCFGGQGRAIGRLAAPRTAAASPWCPQSRTSSVNSSRPPPRGPRGTPSAASSQAQKPCSECRPRGAARTVNVSRPSRSPRPVPLADKRSVRLPLPVVAAFRPGPPPP